LKAARVKVKQLDQHYRKQLIVEYETLQDLAMSVHFTGLRAMASRR
jgi:hypothetical protein